MVNDLPSCRLCLGAHGKNVFNIFDERCGNTNIASVITKYFWFEIKEEEFNKYVCAICWSKIDDFHIFYTQIYNIHNEFSSKVPEISEVEDKIILNTYTEERCKLKEFQATALEPKPKLENEFSENKICITGEKPNDEFSDDNYNVDQSSDAHDYLPANNMADNTEDQEKFSVKDEKSSNSRAISKQNVKTIVDPVHQVETEEENKQIREYFSMECELCSVRCDTFKNIKIHYRKEHKLKGYLRCCNRKFSKRSTLIEHIERHLNPDTFKCEICDKIYVHKRGLLEHQKWHLSSEKTPFKCSQCSKSYTKKFILENHLKTHKNEKFECDDCGKFYNTKKLLQMHTKNMHGGSNVFICDVCAKEYRSKVVFEQHQKSVHENIALPKVQCQICGIWLKHKHSLRQHMFRHEQSKFDHFCSICGKQCLNRNALTSHVKTVHSDKVYNCSLCEKSFRKPKSLKEHMATHTGVTLYSCPHCPKTFNSSANMYSHKKKIHVKEWEEQERLKATGFR